jgi:hypothetical protein
VEITANQTPAVTREAQMLNDLTATGNEAGLLLNLGAASRRYRQKFRGSKASQSR